MMGANLKKKIHINKIESKDMIKIKGYISEIQRFSVHDGPGIRTIVFLKGCPLRCKWCQNPESMNAEREIQFDIQKCISCLNCIKICPNNAITLKNKKLITDKKLCKLCGRCIEECYTEARKIVGEISTVEEVYNEVEKDKVFYKNTGGGITLSGGEPLLQWKFSVTLLKKCKENSINTAIETCGFAKWENFKAVLEYTDYLLFDIKIANPVLHKEYTGQTNELILSNLMNASKLNKIIVIRLPLIPGVSDSPKNLKETVIISKKVNAIEIHILPYHEIGVGKYKTVNRHYMLRKTHLPSNKEIEDAKKYIESEGIEVNTGGLGKNINLIKC